MKKSRRALSLILSMLLLSLTLIMPVNADSDLPESKHDYENNSYEQWHYEYSGNAKGLYVTFSGLNGKVLFLKHKIPPWYLS